MSIVGVEGRIKIITGRVGARVPARFLSIAEEDSVSEIAEVTHSETDALQNFGFVVAAFNKAIRPWEIHRIEDLVEPVTVCVCTIVELGQNHDFHSQQPVCELSSALSRGAGADHSEELIFQAVGIGQARSNFKYECQLVSLFICQFFHGSHQQISGFLEVFPELDREFVLLVLPDPFHCPVDLPDNMVPVRDNHGVFKANLCYLPKVRIHVANKVFNILSGFKL